VAKGGIIGVRLFFDNQNELTPISHEFAFRHKRHVAPGSIQHSKTPFGITEFLEVQASTCTNPNAQRLAAPLTNIGAAANYRPQIRADTCCQSWPNNIGNTVTLES
jgi:hypothetical protein